MDKYRQIELKGDVESVLKGVFEDPEAQPDFVPQTPPRKQGHQKPIQSVRQAEYRGHEIVIKTTYDITIDGKPFRGHVEVEDDGHLHCHSLPYATYPSAVDFVKAVIDVYPDSFRRADPPPVKGGHDHE